jgi:aspartate racemase
VSGWRTIGVIGGMGPAATADFLARLVRHAGAARDSEHPRVLVDSNPQVPDRNAALAGTGPSPGPALAAMARGLAAQSAEILAMPCNAAHGWAGDIRAATDLPFIDMIDATVAAATSAGVRTAGLIGVAATIGAGLYQARLAAHGIGPVLPDPAAVAAIVARVKAGDTGPDARGAAAALAAALREAGADTIIAACTEIPLVLDAGNCPLPLLDTTDILARATLAAARR